MVERMARLNIGPGKAFDMASFTPDVRDAITAGVADGVILMNETPRGKNVNGWDSRLGNQGPRRKRGRC